MKSSKTSRTRVPHKFLIGFDRIPPTTLRSDCPCSQPASAGPQGPWQTKMQRVTQPRRWSFLRPMQQQLTGSLGQMSQLHRGEHCELGRLSQCEGETLSLCSEETLLSCEQGTIVSCEEESECIEIAPSNMAQSAEFFSDHCSVME